jgi:uncharacterized protein (DUF362 family)/Pyruvate/2-oxoacid:ferredoxin oxidoreductase delta subunit
VVRALQEAGHAVIIADSYSGAFRWTAKRLHKVYRITGMTAIAQQTNCELNDDLTWQVVDLPRGSLLKRVEVLTVVSKVDWIVNVPKLKTHAYTGITCAVKNLFGLVPGHYKVGYHARFREEPQFSQALKDLAVSLPVRATVVDGIVAMEGNGPAAGSPVLLGIMFGGGDLLAVDTVAAQFCGMSSRHIPWLEQRTATIVGARAEDIAPGGIKKPTTSLPDMGVFSNPVVRSLAARLLKRAYAPPPALLPGKCTQCHACANGCPKNAIATTGGVPTIDKKQCIRCYCCFEACEHDAITIPQSRMGRWLA